MFEQSLFARLKTQAANVYPGTAPLNYATPAVVYNRINTDPLNSLDASADSAILVIQVDVYDPSYLAAKQLAKTLRDDLVEWNDGVSVSWNNETDMVDETTEKTLFRTMLHFTVFASV